MALVVADRVKETTTTTGTGTVTLLGAVTGFQSFSVVGNANTTYYCIAGQGTSEWEVGIGTYTSAGTTLARTTVLASSNAGSLVSFSAGTKDVFVTYPAGYTVTTQTGNAVSASTVANTGAVTTNATYYPLFAAANTTSNQATNTATSFTFNPSTGALTSTTHVASSDERLKTNWRDLGAGFLERLAKVKYGTYDRTDFPVTQDGVAAQSLQTVLPYSVVADENGMLAVNYGNAALVSAIELAQRVVDQEARIAKLEAMVAQLTKGNIP